MRHPPPAMGGDRQTVQTVALIVKLRDDAA